MSNYPEHEKLALVKDHTQQIGEFVDWLSTEKGIHLAEYWDDHSYTGCMLGTFSGIRDLMAEYYDIDQDRLEDEKRAMLETARNMQ